MLGRTPSRSATTRQQKKVLPAAARKLGKDSELADAWIAATKLKTDRKSKRDELENDRLNQNFQQELEMRRLEMAHEERMMEKRLELARLSKEQIDIN
jgi:hypothetical protein